MSFNAHSIAAPHFLLAVIVLCVMAPGFVEEGPPTWAFWTAGILSVPVFLFVYVPLALDFGDPGSGFWCGAIVAGPLVYVFFDDLSPLARALAPWGVLMIGPAVVLSGGLLVRGWDTLTLRLGRQALAKVERPADLLPFLTNHYPALREAALDRLRQLPADPGEEVALLGAYFAGIAAAPRELYWPLTTGADPLVEAVLARGAPPRTQLLELWVAAPGGPAGERLEGALLEQVWDDPTPLIEAARARLLAGNGRNVDGVVRLLLERDRPAALDLATGALVLFGLEPGTLLEIGPPDALAVIERVIAEQEASGEVYPAPLVEGLLALPMPATLPLLTRTLTAWPGRTTLDLTFSRRLREQPETFAGADQDPEAAAAFLDALAARLADPEDGSPVWADVASAVREALAQDPPA